MRRNDRPTNAYRALARAMTSPHALWRAVAVAAAAASVPAAHAADRPGTSLARDFLIENVCLGAQGKLLVGVSPIDGNPQCVSQRDLKPGEALPYHEREWPASGGSPGEERGSDSFPVLTRAFGIIAIHVYDYETDTPGRMPDHYDPRARIGGGTIATFSGDTVSFVATQLGDQNLKLFVGEGCGSGQPVGVAGLRDSWLLAPLGALAAVHIPPGPPSGSAPIAGSVVTTPSTMVDAGGPGSCPSFIRPGSTRWSIQPVTYRAVYKAGPLAGHHVRLWTLIAERTGQGAMGRDHAIAFERAYFTRELGWTRWEAWKSLNGGFGGNSKWASGGAGSNSGVTQAHQRVAARANCDLPEGAQAPADSSGTPRGDLAMVGCVDVTNIVGPHGAGGDPAPVGPGTWYDSVVHADGPLGALFSQ
jgi:hypothetical protein